MLLTTWPLARLGSRFGLLFEPQHRRIMHSALGRFLDQPLDLAVGLIDPDGTERVMPFTQQGQLLYGCEQRERINSITYRGFSEQTGLKLELNFHSPFYPQDQMLCLMPAFYVEIRVTWMDRIRKMWDQTEMIPCEDADLFIRIKRPDTQLRTREHCICMEYDVPLAPRYQRLGAEIVDVEEPTTEGEPPIAHVRECLHSLNDQARAYEDEHGVGLRLTLPVTAEDSGTKWRLIWAAHTPDPIFDLGAERVPLRYTRDWPDLETVVEQAVALRDEHLARSRRFEKVLEQTPLTRSRWHLLTLGFQQFLANTFWLARGDGGEWFGEWEGSKRYINTVDVEYNVALLYLTIWPDLLRMILDQWTDFAAEHAESGGGILQHDIGQNLKVGPQVYHHKMPVEENANFLLLLHTYMHWTGDKSLLQNHADFVRKLAEYLIWADRDNSGFPSEGTANTVDDATPAMQYARKQTYLAIKRVVALRAASHMLSLVDREEVASNCRAIVDQAVRQIEAEAWLGDHFAVCVDPDATGLTDVWTGKPLPYEKLPGWDDYSIYTSNALLLPALIGRKLHFDPERIIQDLTSSIRETVTPYGCGHTSSQPDHIRISQNIWRDHTGRYLGAVVPLLEGRYWDLQLYSNTNGQSFGFMDFYITSESCFYSRGAVAFGYFLAGPRIQIDRLIEGESKIAITPDRYRHSRWPLLPLADWAAGKIPVCCVDSVGNIRIEGELEPVQIKQR